jgi:hypothetical protein
MRKMKRLLEFADFTSGINIESVDGVPFNRFNKTIFRGDFDFGEEEFSVLLSCDGEKKEVSLPYDLFLEYIEKSDANLSAYLNKLSDFDKIFTELKEFGWDFQKAIEGYINDNYNPETFSEIETFDGLKDDFDDWDDEDQEKYNDLVD